MKYYEDDYLMALERAHKDPEAHKFVESLIKEHFATIQHMKETSLWDVFEYKKRLTEPLKIFAHENQQLKKEVNDLRKKLGKIPKYKEE